MYLRGAPYLPYAVWGLAALNLALSPGACSLLQKCIDDGRVLSTGAHNVRGITVAKELAEVAGASAPLVMERAAAARAVRETPQGQLAQAVFALPYVTTDFEVLGKRGASQLAAQLLLFSPTPLVESVLALKHELGKPGASSSLPEEVVLQRIRGVIRTHALPCLRRTDWKRGNVKVPHVGLVYVILLTMSAADIHRECVRVLVKGEAISQMFHEQLGDGYKIMLSQVSTLQDCRNKFMGFLNYLGCVYVFDRYAGL